MLHLVIKHFSIHGLHTHALSDTNGVGQSSHSPSHLFFFFFFFFFLVWPARPNFWWHIYTYIMLHMAMISDVSACSISLKCLHGQLSRSNDNSRVALLVCDEHLLAYPKGHGALQPTADRGRKRCTGDATEVQIQQILYITNR